MAQPVEIEPSDDTAADNGDIKADIRHLDNRLTGDIRGLRSDIKEVRTDVKRLSDKMDAGYKELGDKMDAGCKELGDKMDKKFTSLFQLIMVGFTCLGFLSLLILYK